MSWTDEEIDKMFQEGAEGLNFEYKESYWKEMESMLPKGGSKGDFLWFFTAFVFLGFFGVMTLFTLPDANQSATTLAADERVDAQDKSTSSLNIEKVTLTKPEATSATATEIDQLSIAQDIEENPNANKPSGTPLINNQNITTIEISDSKLVEDQAGQTISESHESSKTVEVPEFGVSMEQEIIDNSAITLEGQTNSIERQEISSSQIPVGNLNYLDLFLLEEDSRNLAMYPMYPSKLSTSTSMYVQALGGLSQSLISPSKQLSNSFGIGAGVQFKNRNWTYSIGVNGIVSAHKDLVLNRTAKVYGFGSEVYNYQLNYKQVYILEGNLQVAYSFGRHNMSLGVRPSYAMSSKVKMSEEKFANSILDDSELNERNVYGFMDGLKRIGVKPSIGYSYSLKPGLEIGMNVGVQLMPMINEDFLDGYTNKLPIDGQLYFRKTIDFK